MGPNCQSLRRSSHLTYGEEPFQVSDDQADEIDEVGREPCRGINPQFSPAQANW